MNKLEKLYGKDTTFKRSGQSKKWVNKYPETFPDTDVYYSANLYLVSSKDLLYLFENGIIYSEDYEKAKIKKGE